MNTKDMVVKFLHSNKTFLTCPTRAAGYTTANMSNMVVKSPNTDKKMFNIPNKGVRIFYHEHLSCGHEVSK